MLPADPVSSQGVLAHSSMIYGIDINPDMISIAKKLLPKANWKTGDAFRLPFDDNSFDNITCQFGLMFFPDKSQSIREMARVLRSGGKISVCVWDKLGNIPVFKTMANILERIAGNKAATALEVSFSLEDPEELRKIFAAATLVT